MNASHDQKTKDTGKSWDEAYRDKWRWDRVAWGTHCVDCYPCGCSYRVYVRDGKIVREEPSANYTTVETGVPDMNPTGCQKGASWSRTLTDKSRVLYPMRRAGERGEGKWERISWDEALTSIADSMLDAIKESGPRSIVRIGSSEGGVQSLALANHLFQRLGATVTDAQGELNDLNPGVYLTFGRMASTPSADDWFHSELIIIWANNPVYSTIPYVHYLAESRYGGCEVVTIAPDYSPSAIHADQFIPVRGGSDAALALAMCRVMIDENLVDAGFVREQTDLGFLIRADNGRFLRQSDVAAGGAEDVFHVFDTRSGKIVEAPGTLDLGGLEPALEGSYHARLHDGSVVEVAPAFVPMRRRLDAYAPEQASALCGVHADVIRQLARKVAAKRTRILGGWTLTKSYHGDLMERAQCLLLALSGNWGKKGAGFRSVGLAGFEGPYMLPFKTRAGQQATLEMVQAAVKRITTLMTNDPTLTPELIAMEQAHSEGFDLGVSSPFLYWYYHCGYREIWNNPDWNDPARKRTFDAYVKESIERGWWQGSNMLAPEDKHHVMFNIGSNPLRTIRGGKERYLDGAWGQTRMIVCVDFRLSTTALYSDIVLPAAQHYEKTNFPFTSPEGMNVTFSDRVVEPAGEARSEWQMFVALAKKISERATARGIDTCTRQDGRVVQLADIYKELTFDGALAEDDAILDEAVRDSAIMGTLPPETTLASFREQGWIRPTAWGGAGFAMAQASDLRPDETHSPYRWQTEKKQGFPTLTRRAQFYIDHEWWLEAGEELPVHKEPPRHGGNYPLAMTSGHPRASIHAMQTSDQLLLGTTRGEPLVHLNDGDARARGIDNGAMVRIFNDLSSVIAQARVTPAVRPGQLIAYIGFEPYQFKNWKNFSSLESGMVKWLQLAGGYGHIKYLPFHWQPEQTDRGVRVEVERAP